MSEHIEIRESWGAVLAIATDNAGTTTRYWFDETSDGELVHFAEVIELPSGRQYVEESEMLVPPKVEEALRERGYVC